MKQPPISRPLLPPLALSSRLHRGFLVYLFFFAAACLLLQVDQGLDASMAIEPMAGGVLIGMTTMMCFLSLMTAVYWGQMSG